MIVALRKIEDRGAAEIAKREARVFLRSSATPSNVGPTGRNLVADMKDVLKTRRASHFAAIDTDERPAFLAALERNEARMFEPARIAMRLMLLIS